MWGEENRPTPPVAGFSDEEPARADDAPEPPVATEQEPERKPAPVYALIRYEVTDQRIAELRESFAGLAERTPENYEPRRKAIATCRELRVAVEKKRKELKADSLEWGRKVDSIAKHFTGLLESIENPLQLAKDADDAEKDRIKREAEQAKKAALEAQVRAEREAEEARLRAEREAEGARLVQERADLDAERAELAEKLRLADEAAKAERERVDAAQAAERKRLDEEGARLKAEREKVAQEAQAERDKIAAERRALDEQRERAEREEFQRRAKIQAEADAAAKAERDRVAAEEARVAELERQAAQARRLEALKPDAEKLQAWGARISEIAAGEKPAVSDPEAQAAVEAAVADLFVVVKRLARFGHPPQETP